MPPSNQTSQTSIIELSKGQTWVDGGNGDDEIHGGEGNDEIYGDHDFTSSEIGGSDELEVTVVMIFFMVEKEAI